MGSLQEGNVSLAKLHIEHVVNYIVGGEGVDANGDGTISNLGDGGPGIILGDDGVGYADDHKHAGFAMGQAPNDATVNRHGAEALAGAANVEAWVTEALTQANRAVNSPSPIFVELWLRDTIGDQQRNAALLGSELWRVGQHGRLRIFGRSRRMDHVLFELRTRVLSL